MTQKAVEGKIVDEGRPSFKKAFSSFSVDDLEKAKSFYDGKLSLDVTATKEGLEIKFENGHNLFIYPKQGHQPAGFTVLNLNVDDIDGAVESLTQAGVVFEQYSGELKTDEKGIFRGSQKGQGPDIAWFKDPAGNIISVVEE